MDAIIIAGMSALQRIVDVPMVMVVLLGRAGLEPDAGQTCRGRGRMRTRIDQRGARRLRPPGPHSWPRRTPCAAAPCFTTGSPSPPPRLMTFLHGTCLWPTAMRAPFANLKIRIGFPLDSDRVRFSGPFSALQSALWREIAVTHARSSPRVGSVGGWSYLILRSEPRNRSAWPSRLGAPDSSDCFLAVWNVDFSPRQIDLAMRRFAFLQNSRVRNGTRPPLVHLAVPKQMRQRRERDRSAEVLPSS